MGSLAIEESSYVAGDSMTSNGYGYKETDEQFSLANIRSQRREFEPSQWGVAAPSSSEQFKLRSHAHKPRALRWDHRISPESAMRAGSSLKAAFKYLKNSNVISLGSGLPLSEYFPFEGLDITVPLRNEFSDVNERLDKTINLHASKHDLVGGVTTYDLATALNYSQGSGSAQLLRWITEHTEIVHNPPYRDWQCTMTIGNTSALDMALRMFSKPGDYILSDEYTFATAVETAMPMQVKFIGAKMDQEGMLPESLRSILETWDPAAFGGARKPFLIYTIPTGQNPTGATQGLQRRRDIYTVAQEHDLIILEDDPYYFLQMDRFVVDSKHPPVSTNHMSSCTLLKSLVPSFLSIDTDGRVFRMDSFSKVVSPGTRLGWITASHQVVERYKIHADVSTQGPSGLSQLALFKLLDEHWGHVGYFNWLIYLRREYTKRRDFIIKACDRSLPKEIVTWKPPEAGMFQWLKVDWSKHPDARAKAMSEIEEDIWLGVINHGALIARGSWFFAESNKAYDDMFFRLTFAAAPLKQIELAVSRLGRALKESFKLN